MTEAELRSILSLRNAAIIAPAGHGKTEMIVDLVANTGGKQLLLTHTNAGVDVLEKRLKKKNIARSKYTISTIAAYCMKWCTAYSESATYNMDLSPHKGGDEAKQYYTQLYVGTKTLFSQEWPGIVLKNSYEGIIVDEYQDCIKEQHEIILSLNRFLPIRVFGDPLQGIFSFAGALVDWNDLGFQFVPVETKPWRWLSSNPKLGEYLSDMRTQIESVLSGKTDTVHFVEMENCIQMVDPQYTYDYGMREKTNKYASILFLSRWEYQQKSLCIRMPDIFRFDEKQECEVLFDFAERLDSNIGPDRALAVLDFASECATGVTKEVKSFRSNLQKGMNEFPRIRTHLDLGKLLVEICISNSCDSIMKVLSWFRSGRQFKIYRYELFLEMIRSLQFATSNNCSVLQAANRIRKEKSLQRRYDFQYLSTRTVLSKGLECDCVIIDMRDPWSAKDFYVAMTRAKSMVYIITASSSVVLSR